jgi:RimJ/RimL family protein N-acetyltransferase
MKGRFCRVEPLEPSIHAASLFAANALDTAGRNWTYLAYGPFESLETYRPWLEQWRAESDVIAFAIVDTKTDRAIGVAGYLRIDPKSGSIEVGHLNFSPLLQRKPAATEAMFRMMQRAFELGYRRYEWKCHALNTASRAAAERLGFSYEGVFRQATVVKGRNRDTAWYAMIDQEWPELRTAFTKWLDPANFDQQGNQHVSLSSLTGPILKKRG